MIGGRIRAMRRRGESDFGGGFFGGLGWLVGRGGIFVVGLWVVAAILAYQYLPPLDERVTGNVSDLIEEPEGFISGSAGELSSGQSAESAASSPGGVESPEGAGEPAPGGQDGGGGSSDGSPPSEVPSGGETPTGGGSDEALLSGVVEAPAMLVFTDEGGLDAEDYEEIASRLARFEGGERPYRLVSAVPVPLDGFGAAGRQTTLPVLLFFEAGISPTGIGTGTEEARELASGAGGGITVEATGTAPAQNDAADAIEESLPVVTAATLAAIFLILAFTYRSVVTPLIPLASIGLSAFLTLRLLAYFATKFEVQIPSQVEPVILVLIFGVGTDYALFLLSRTRDALNDGFSRRGAAQIGVEKAGPVVACSAAVLIAAFMVLAGAELEIYRALGPGLALSLSVVTLVTLTLVPALLAVLGRLAFGRSGRRLQGRDARRGTGFLVRHPGLVAGAVVGVLAVASLGALGLRVGFDQVGALPDDAPASRGYAALSESAPAGILSPINVIVGGDELASLDQDEASYRLERLKNELWATGGYAAVIGPDDPGLLASVEFLSPDGRSARYVLVPYGSPYSPDSLDDISGLREGMERSLERSELSGLEVRYGGQAILAAEAREISADDLTRLAPLVFGVAFLIIALLLRTPVAPLYLILSTALGFTATLGIATVFFQGMLGADGVVYYVPFALFLLLVALGSDYNIFIMSAIRGESRSKPLSEAVPAALATTRRTISAAGLALSASFALLALIPLDDFRQIGLTVALGILIDTFIIRPLLVPALVLLLGRRGFWPAKIRE